MNDTPHTSPSKEYFTRKCTEAVAALKQLGLPVPATLLELDDLRPLALSTWQIANEFAVEHYGQDNEEAKALLHRCIWAYVRTPQYAASLGADLSTRVNLVTGEPEGMASDLDRHSAALSTFVKALRTSAKNAAVPAASPAKPKPPPPQPPKPPAPPPSPSPAVPKPDPLPEEQVRCWGREVRSASLVLGR
jgi:hypothetical protein